MFRYIGKEGGQMAQVSQKSIGKKEWEQVWKRLLELVRGEMEGEEAEVVLTGLLTRTERVMLAKRLMVWVLLEAGWSVPKVCQVLKLSVSTGYKFQALFERDEKLAEVLRKRIKVEKSRPGRQAKLEELVEMLGKVLTFTYRVKYPGVFEK